ncbi:FUSC family protein [Nocardioides taihuensis]|uniref:Aromatic acid exporter family protein n=1 Tax=Nocardioides taihuensis TaxID=1835606 RepID=A0ABW0BH63_9ACTN
MATAPTPRRERWRDPVLWTGVIQLVKTAAAGVIAWVVATTVLDLPQSFLAPWAALLVVHSTVYRTFAQGSRQVAAAVVGVVLAWAVGHVLSLDATAVAVVLLVGLLLGSMRWFGAEGTTLAATALVVLTTGFTDEDTMLFSRLADTGIGIGVGLAVNLLVWPPLRRRTAIAAMDQLDDRLGELVVDLAGGVERGFDDVDAERWLDRVAELDDDVDRAWSLVRQARESARMNPRRSAQVLREPREWVGLLRRVEQALAEIRSTVRTLTRALDDEVSWRPDFRDGYVDVLRAVGRAIASTDPEPVRQCHVLLADLVTRVEASGSTTRLWPVYGGLLVNLRNILDAMDEVAAANPMVQPPLPFARRARP